MSFDIMSIVNPGVQRSSVVNDPKDIDSSQADTVSTEVILTSRSCRLCSSKAILYLSEATMGIVLCIILMCVVL